MPLGQQDGDSGEVHKKDNLTWFESKSRRIVFVTDQPTRTHGQQIMSNPFSPASVANVLCLLVVLLWYSTSRKRARPVRPKSCTIVVLGDIGRSPRMMYHAESLLRHGWSLHIIGQGSELSTKQVVAFLSRR